MIGASTKSFSEDLDPHAYAWGAVSKILTALSYHIRSSLTRVLSLLSATIYYMTFFLVLLLVLSLLCLFYRVWPPFGAVLAGARKRQLALSKNYKNNRFINSIPTTVGVSFRDSRGMMAELLRRGAHRWPKGRLQPAAFDPEAFLSGGTHIVWLGHSTCLLRIDGKTILFDPVFSKRASPFQWAGPKRFAGSLAVTVADLPPIDAVVLSHDHYDHLDYGSIRALRGKAQRFFAPLGLGAHLQRWGVADERITELDWWGEAKADGLTFACTPARHFSGRRLGDRAATLWASWVIMSKRERIYFSGDTGYGPHFAKIGKRYGPFDLTCLECGQYDEHWTGVHMMPEETVQAAKDLRSKLILPIHWGAFVLAFHSWTDPVVRAGKAAKRLKIPFATPQLGQLLRVPPAVPSSRWWESAE
jgi:L-ascorbate metabolism protein UlaG (beta-lactamase superfamily)